MKIKVTIKPFVKLFIMDTSELVSRFRTKQFRKHTSNMVGHSSFVLTGFLPFFSRHPKQA